MHMEAFFFTVSDVIEAMGLSQHKVTHPALFPEKNEVTTRNCISTVIAALATEFKELKVIRLFMHFIVQPRTIIIHNKLVNFCQFHARPLTLKKKK